MLNIINSLGLSNILVIVTRYFGGILLGTGGLVRAYSEATHNALDKAKIISMDLGFATYIEVEYGDLNKAKYYLEQNCIEVTNQEFGETIKIFINLTEQKYNQTLGKTGDFNFKILSFGKGCKKYIKNVDN